MDNMSAKCYTFDNKLSTMYVVFLYLFWFLSILVEVFTFYPCEVKKYTTSSVALSVGICSLLGNTLVVCLEWLIQNIKDWLADAALIHILKHTFLLCIVELLEMSFQLNSTDNI